MEVATNSELTAYFIAIMMAIGFASWLILREIEKLHAAITPPDSKSGTEVQR